jgi:hypothetical protein
MESTTAKKPVWKRWWFWVLAVLILIVIASSGSDGSNDSSSQADAPETTYSLNEDVRSSDVVWRVTEVEDRGITLKASQSRYAVIADDKTTTGKFVQVTVIVENTGDDLASITSPGMIDSQGREFTDASASLSEWLPEDQSFLGLTNLQPNLPKTFAFIYEVPSDATGLQLKVGVFKPKVIDLGL